MAEPQITEIASYFANHLPGGGGVDPDEAKDEWRHTLRRARRIGAIRWLADLVEQQAPADPTVREHCEALRSEPCVPGPEDTRGRSDGTPPDGSSWIPGRR